MDMAELVRTIVQEVLERSRTIEARPCVRVLAVRDASLAEQVKTLVAPYYADGADVVFSSEEGAERRADRYILPRLSCSDMADLAAGRASSPCMEETLGLLLQGRKVEVLEFAYHSYAATAPGPLYERYASYEKVLAGYGLRAFRPQVPERLMVRERLITAAVVERAEAEGYRMLIVPAAANVTPLAAERADALHMSIVKEGQGR